ncbi:MAG: hypothetical protein EON54_11170 [Alcaligenaceae bacterium]|nr:MAG: hypothetical protein EON54_11170 [Alcaligenaceae bacterium]
MLGSQSSEYIRFGSISCTAAISEGKINFQQLRSFNNDLLALTARKRFPCARNCLLGSIPEEVGSTQFFTFDCQLRVNSM